MQVGTENIQFHYLVSGFRFMNRKKLKAFLAGKFVENNREVEQLNYIFCNDDYLLKINQDYLKHNTLTDIVTFELSPKAQPLISDIYISVDRVKENSKIFKTSFERELHRVIFHGVLHLLGYKDKKREDQERMRQMEDTYLKEYIVPRSTVS